MIRALTQAFGHNFQFAVQLRSFVHFCANVTGKLKERGFHTSVSKEFLADIFVCQSGNTFEEGLVDCESAEDVGRCLEQLKPLWESREARYLSFCSSCLESGFYKFFTQHQLEVVKYHNIMRKDIRESVCLGSPPTIYTTNGSESINAAIKSKVNFIEPEWPRFNDQMKVFATHQQEEIIRSLFGRGQYRLKPEFSHYGVSKQEWLKMRLDQRRALVANCEKAVIPHSNGSRTQKSQSPAAAASHERINGLSISAEDSGITLIPLTTLNGI